MTDFVAREPRLRWANVSLLTLASAAMLALIVLVYQTIEAEREQRALVTHTTEILEELRQIYRVTLNGETGQRGYLVTLDRRYLEPYEAGRQEVGPALDRLQALLGQDSSPRQRELADQIDALTRAKFAEMRESVTLLEDGRLLDARRSVLTDSGIETMERLRSAIREMENIESRELDQAIDRTGKAERRVMPLLGGLLVMLVLAMLGALRLVGRTARAEAEAAQAAELAKARDRADLLARELNHRVKNLFAVVLAIVRMSARDRPEAQQVTETIADRIHALLKAHEVSQGAIDHPVASLRTLVETTLAPYRSGKHEAETDGPEVMLPAKRVTSLGLILHELTTNAVKYGAWKDDGKLHVSWERDGNDIRLVWRETGAALTGEPESQGFGSLLMTSATRQLSGTVDRRFAPDGLIVTLTFGIGDPRPFQP